MNRIAGTLGLGLLLVAVVFSRAADSPSLQLARQLNEAFVEVADKVSPSVVVIRVAQKNSDLDLDDENNPWWDMMPKEFRRRLEERREQQKRENKSTNPSHPPVFNGQGSGVIISEDGYILTNFHVVEDAEAIQVRLRDDPRRYTATVKGTDPQSDIAVIKITATNLTTAKLGDSTAVRVGEFAIAIGAPFEFDYSVTFGHISAKSRSHVIPAFGVNSQGASMDQDFLQTDASINPGNSGGPLVNLYGEVIGINTLIRGLHTGISFAVPINLARDVSTQLIRNGKFVRSWLGIGIRGLRETEPYEPVQGIADGVLVTDIRPDGPARNSDLKPGDIILSVDGRQVETANQLRNEVRTKPSGTNIILDVVRFDDKQRSKKLKIGVRPEPWPEKLSMASLRSAAKPDPADLGFTAEPVTPELKKRYSLEADASGLVVTDVSDSGPASGQIKTGELVVGINHRPVKTTNDLESAAAKADLSRGVLVEVETHGTNRSVVLRVP